MITSPRSSPRSPRVDRQKLQRDWEKSKAQVVQLAVDEIRKHKLDLQKDTVKRVLEDVATSSPVRGFAAGHYDEYRKYMPEEESGDLIRAILDAASA